MHDSVHAAPSHNILLLIPIILQHFPVENTAANHLFELPTAFRKLPAVKGTCMSLLLASAAPTHFPWPVTPLSQHSPAAPSHCATALLLSSWLQVTH